MLKNYLKIAYRNFIKTKLFSAINILGLSIGMTACLLILHYVNFEKSYDQFHKDIDQIYRLRYERISENGSAVRFASCTPPAGALIRERFPEVDILARIFRYRGVVVSHQNIKFTEERVFHAEPEFVDIFDFNFIEGDPKKALGSVDNALISQSIAKKYFGSEDPIGKILKVDQKTAYQVSGIFEDLPKNSHIKFDFLLSFENFAKSSGPDYMENWGHTGMFTYLILKPGSDLGFDIHQTLVVKAPRVKDDTFGEKIITFKNTIRTKSNVEKICLVTEGRHNLALFAIKIKTENINETLTMIQDHYDEFFAGNPFDYFFLDEYFDQQYKSDLLFGRVFGIFAILAIFVTSLGVLGLVAFMVTQRTKEIGIRKVLGADIRQVLNLLTFDILKLIIVSFIFVTPIMYWGIGEWLQTFATQMSIDAGLFILPLVLTLIVTFTTIGMHVIQAALANPIEALRYE